MCSFKLRGYSYEIEVKIYFIRLFNVGYDNSILFSLVVLLPKREILTLYVCQHLLFTVHDAVKRTIDKTKS